MSPLKKMHQYALGKTQVYLPVYPLPDSEICGFDIPFSDGLFLHIGRRHSWDDKIEIAVIIKLPYTSPIWMKLPKLIGPKQAQMLIDIHVIVGAKPEKETF